jgi:hypothetical protein
MKQIFLNFSDNLIPYNVFLKDISAYIVKILKEQHDDPEYVSQRQASIIFGRKNVERWRASGEIVPIRRGRQLDYKTSDLRYLQIHETNSQF